MLDHSKLISQSQCHTCILDLCCNRRGPFGIELIILHHCLQKRTKKKLNREDEHHPNQQKVLNSSVCWKKSIYLACLKWHSASVFGSAWLTEQACPHFSIVAFMISNLHYTIVLIFTKIVVCWEAPCLVYSYRTWLRCESTDYVAFILLVYSIIRSLS